jgi:hypothetical protein
VGDGSWLLISGTGNIVNPSSPNATVQNIGSGVNVFRWYITNGTCYSSFDEVTVIRTLPPSNANAGLDYTTCNTIEVMNGNTPAIGVGHWNIVYGSVTLVNPQQPAAQVTGISLGLPSPGQLLMVDVLRPIRFTLIQLCLQRLILQKIFLE